MCEVALTRRAAVTLGMVFLAAPLAAGAAVNRAAADEPSGWFTVSGVVGVDEAVVFATLAEAAATIASSEPVEQSADAPVAAIVVHGAAVLEDCPHELWHPVDGAVVAILGADSSASLAGAGGTLNFSSPAGSLVVRGVELCGSATLAARDRLVVDSCYSMGGIACIAGGSVCIAGNALRGPGADGGPALAVDLTGADAVLTVTGNDVSGFPCVAAVRCSSAESRTVACVTSNNLVLDPAWSDAGPQAPVLWFAGGPWAPGSIVRDNNVVENATELLMLDGSFCASVPADREGAFGDWDSERNWFVQSVASDNVAASTLVALFELTGHGSSQLPDGLVAVGIDPDVEAPFSRMQAQEASAVVLPSLTGVSGEGTFCSVSYDANGALGTAPDPVTVECGASVVVATMGSLVCPGYVFAGWNTQPEGLGLFYASGQVFVPQQDTVLYAQWSATGTVATVSIGAAESGV